MVTPLQVFSTTTTTTTKSPSSSTLSSMKIKTLIHTLIISHVCRIVRALSKAKTIIIQILKENQPINYIYSTKATKRKHRQRKIFFGSFRLHYNWCSSHVIPVPAPVLAGFSSSPHLYYDSTWNSVITAPSEENIDDNSSQLSGYLQWLEEKKKNQENSGGENSDDVVNEIDRLADMFIANCHEKFRLEKQESNRRFQEMMARSMM